MEWIYLHFFNFTFLSIPQFEIFDAQFIHSDRPNVGTDDNKFVSATRVLPVSTYRG